ncbi:MAG TPA: GNAT family N-acetyltransferase [Pyrinomonadaceae bacterium]|nr:GNAT family N-acetyltransferase [Pyrinomonadaceae bacterium]
MKVLETERLVLKHLSIEDAAFILRLLNEPSFIQYIGDKKVRTLDDARQYIENGPRKSYEENGFGLNKVELKSTGEPMGISGLVKRDTLPEPDIGFAFLPEYWNQGYAIESARAVMDHARNVLGITRVVAITSPENDASARLLEKIGLRFQRLIKFTDESAEIKLFAPD